MLAYTTKSIFQLQLPDSINPTSSLYIIAQIRDTFDCITEFNLSSVTVHPDFSAIDNFMNNLQELNRDSDTVGQMINSILQVFNEMSEQNVQMTNHIPISSLDNKIVNLVTNSTNDIKFNEELNKHASIRERSMMFINNLTITTSNNIKFQSSILATLTETTNQLTRKTSVGLIFLLFFFY